MKKKIILFELNEVPYKVLDAYSKNNPNSALSKILNKSAQYTTVDEETNTSKLSPWITWSSLHRGVPKAEHKIFDFGQDLSEIDKTRPPIWKILADKKLSVGVFSSLHTSQLPKDLSSYKFYVPDPFTAHSDCHPKKLKSFQNFNLLMSRKSERNVSRSIPAIAAFHFLTDAIPLGMKLSTIERVAKHLLEELKTPHVKVRRRSFQTAIAFDIFYKQLMANKPDFSTFFTNNVASAMHRFWRASFPEDYKNTNDQVSADWQEMYKREVEFALNEASICLEKLANFVDKNTEFTLVVCSSMGQAATQFENAEQILYINDHKLFFQKIGVDTDTLSPVPAMKPQFNFLFKNEDAVKHAINCLNKVTIKQEPIKYRVDGNFLSLDLGHRLIKNDDVKINNTNINSLGEFGLINFENEEKLSSTAYHIPEGSLLIYSANEASDSEKTRRKLSNTEIAPAILQYFEMEPPSYMTSPSFHINH